MLGEPVTSSPSVSVRRLVAAALAAGALVGAAALPATAADHRAARANVGISRVQYDSPGPEDGSNRSLNNEWVEITNHTRHSVNLDGWRLSNKHGQTYVFHHYRLDGHATVRVHSGVGRDSNRDVYQDRRNYVWDNRSDTATLRNDHRRLVDDTSWGGRNPGGRNPGGHDGGGHDGGGHDGGGHDGGGHDGGGHDGGGRNGGGHDGGGHH
nr:lamin tail domain-containing protein [Streptomyces sp. NBC_00886]